MDSPVQSCHGRSQAARTSTDHRAPTKDSPSLVPAMRGAFERAFIRHPHERYETHLILGGRRVRLRAAGRELGRTLTAALAHLRCPDIDAAPCALDIVVWDGAATGVPCPPIAWSDALGSRWEVGQGMFASLGEGQTVGYLRSHSATWLDRKTSSLLGYIRDASELSLFEKGKPFHFLFSVWHHDLDILVVHAGMVARNGKGVLLPGMGGAGKSTTALACLRYGLEYLGDDYIGLEATPNARFVGHSIYSSTWLQPDHYRACFPDLVPHAVTGYRPGEDKHLVFLAPRYAERFRHTATVSAVALPRISNGQETTFQRARKGEALLTAAPSTMLCLVPRPHRAGLDRLASLVQSVPCYWLDLGSDPGRIGPAVEALLEDAAG